MDACAKCNDTGMALIDVGEGFIKGYCDCAEGEGRQKREMCLVCYEMKKDCMCKKEE